MADAVVHVFDPGEPGKTKDFTCSIHALTHGMRYFKDVLQKSVDNRVTPVEISVHCDVAVFEWLLGYCNGRVTRDRITVQSVLPLLIASNFLQMDSLVADCLNFMASNLVAVAQHHQQIAPLGQQGGDLTALPLELLSRLAWLVPEGKLEELASLTPAETRARHMPLVNRLYKYKLEACLRDLKTTVARCSVCQGLFSLAERAKLECPGPQQMQHRRSSSAAAVHIPDASWRLQGYLSSLRAQQIPWRGIYWHMWGLVHVLYCHTCMTFVPAAELRRCTYHPQAPVFAATAAASAAAAAAAARQPTTGFYPCCGASAMRGADPRIGGCCTREHRLIPSGQIPGAPLPAGLSSDLLSTLQHCTPLFTDPGALLVREQSGSNIAPSMRSTVPPDSRTAAAAAAIAASGASTARASSGHRGGLVGKNSAASRTGVEDVTRAADADGRLVPPAMPQAAAGAAAVTQRRGDDGANASANFGPAAAATAAALGYCLTDMPGLDSRTSGPGPPQMLLLPPPPSSYVRQPPREAAQPPQQLATGPSSPLQITGNPQADARRVAAAVARRLSRSSGGGSGAGPVGEAPSQAPQPAAASHPPRLQRNHSHDHSQRHHHQQYPQSQPNPHQQQQLSPRLSLQQQPSRKQQLSSEPLPSANRRPVLDTARSFTSLAALQQQVAEDGSLSIANTINSHRSLPPQLPPPPALPSRVGQGPGDDLDTARGAGSPLAAPTANLRLFLKSATLPHTSGGVGAGGGGAGSDPGFGGSPLMAHLERSPRSRMMLTHSPHHLAGQGKAPTDPALASLSVPNPLSAGQPTAPPPSLSAAAGSCRSRLSPDPRDPSPCHAGEARRSLRAAVAPPGDKQHPQLSHQHHHQQQQQSLFPSGPSLWRQQQLQQGGGHPSSGRVSGRVHAERSGNAVFRWEATLPPRPAGLAATQRRHSGGSSARRDSGDSGCGEEDDDRPQSQQGAELRRPSGVPGAGGGGGGDANPLQRSVQAVLLQQRRRWKELQEEQGNLQQQRHQQHQYHQQQHHEQQQRQQQAQQQQQNQQQAQQQQQNQQQAQQQQQDQQQRYQQPHRQRSASSRARQVGFSSSSPGGPGEEQAAAEEQERRALVEQYKTQKVLSPRPRNVHMIAIAELPSGPNASVGGGGSRAPSFGSAPAPADAADAGARNTTRSWAGAAHSADTRAAAGENALVVSEPGFVGGDLFALPGDEADGSAPLLPAAATETTVQATGTAVAAQVEAPPPVRGRKLRMELLYEDDNFRMDLLVKHLLACRPSHRTVTYAAVGGREQRPYRGKSALAPSSRASAGGSRGRPVSAAAAAYGSRQTRPRSHSVSHLQRLQSVYLPGGVSGTTGHAYSSGGGGVGYSGRLGGGGGGGVADALAGRADAAFGSGAGGEADASSGGRSAMGLPGSSFGLGAVPGGARQSQDGRPLSAPRTWRYT